MFVGDKLGEVMTDNLVTRVTEELFRGAIYPDVSPCKVVYIDRVFCILKQLAIALFTLTQGFLSTLPFRDSLLELGDVTLALFEQLRVLNSARRACRESFRQPRVLRCTRI